MVAIRLCLEPSTALILRPCVKRNSNPVQTATIGGISDKSSRGRGGISAQVQPGEREASRPGAVGEDRSYLAAPVELESAEDEDRRPLWKLQPLHIAKAIAEGQLEYRMGRTCDDPFRYATHVESTAIRALTPTPGLFGLPTGLLADLSKTPSASVLRATIRTLTGSSLPHRIAHRCFDSGNGPSLPHRNSRQWGEHPKDMPILRR